MKLYPATTATRTPDANPRVVDYDARLRRVNAVTGSDPDRQQSLREQLAEVEASAVGSFQDEDAIRQNTHDVAAQILRLGPRAMRLVKRPNAAWNYRPINVRA